MAVANYGEHVTGLETWPLFIGTVTADTTKKVGIKLPWKYDLLGFRTFARASSGTTPTLTADLLEAGVSVLSTPTAVVADTYTDGTVSDSALADEAELTVNLDIGGTDTPTFTDVTLTLCLRRTN
jgi:hypothetical protein